jgi:hypothetical protein
MQTPDKTPKILGIDAYEATLDLSFLVMTSAEVNWICTLKTYESMIQGKKVTAEKDGILMKMMVKNAEKMKDATKKIQSKIDMERVKAENK